MPIPTHADSYYRIGASHRVCQDYALAGVSESGTVYAMVSDGCSSSHMTDVGARIVLHCTENHIDALSAHHSEGTEPRCICFATVDTANSMGVDRTALDATRLALTVGASEETLCSMLGDGCVILVSQDSVIVHGRKFDKNMPPYYRYLLRQSDADKYMMDSQSSTPETLHRYFGAWGPAGYEILASPSRQCDPVRGKLSQGICSLVTSDGIDSFVGADGTPVCRDDVLDALLDFKSFAGEFIQRRCKAFFEKTCVERGWKHLDDFSLAGIYHGDKS